MKNNCDDCYYRGTIYNTACCNYLLMTDQRRPCPPGEECTVKVRRKDIKRRKRRKKA